MYSADERDRRVDQYLSSKPDRDIAALLLQEVLPELGALGHAAAIVESAVDRLTRASGGALKGSERDVRARRTALEESDASRELFTFNF